MKHNDYFIFSVIDSWDVHSDENIKYGAILSFDAVHAGSLSHTKVNK